ncbi:sulfatase [Prosthecobacter sp.]|uniref:sulfatase n=1 Tax=Prosthecobacter sp. TaxID=1965333 RepID=UPI003785301B
MKHLLLFLTIVSAHAAAAQPNVLFIAVDDMRCELGCYGAGHVLSPNLDRLAASGVLFERAYCQQAVCNPSRASIMTGLRPDTTHVWDLKTDFRQQLPDAVTIPQHFRRHGYRAVAYGKIFHNSLPDEVSWDEPTHHTEGTVQYSPENQQRLADYKAEMKAAGKSQAAITRMRGPATEMQEQPDEKNPDGRQTTDAIAKMRELSDGSAPFFLAVGYIRPHLPFITPRKYWDLYDRAKLPLADNGFMPRGAPAVAFGDRSMGGFYELRDYLDYANAPSPFVSPLTEPQQRELRHGYYASVSFIDTQVGRLLAALKELSLAENTVVVLWSDHGWKLGEHGGWCKQTNYEIDTRSPLMIRAPGAKANGSKCAALVEFVDVYPTLCELAGLPVPSQLEGRSLLPLLTNSATKVKDAAISQFERTHEGRRHMGYAIRTETHRYIEWLDATSGDIVAQELYDHSTDPAENENLALKSDRRALLSDLSGQLWNTIPRPKFPHAWLERAPRPENTKG